MKDGREMQPACWLLSNIGESHDWPLNDSHLKQHKIPILPISAILNLNGKIPNTHDFQPKNMKVHFLSPKSDKKNVLKKHQAAATVNIFAFLGTHWDFFIVFHGPHAMPSPLVTAPPWRSLPSSLSDLRLSQRLSSKQIVASNSLQFLGGPMGETKKHTQSMVKIIWWLSFLSHDWFTPAPCKHTISMQPAVHWMDCKRAALLSSTDVSRDLLEFAVVPGCVPTACLIKQL